MVIQLGRAYSVHSTLQFISETHTQWSGCLTDSPTSGPSMDFVKLCPKLMVFPLHFYGSVVEINLVYDEDINLH